MQSAFPATLQRKDSPVQKLVMVRIDTDGLTIYSDTENHHWTASDIESARWLDDGSMILQNGELFLDVVDPGFALALKSVFGNLPAFRRSFFDKAGLKGCLIILLSVGLPLFAAYFWLVPHMADRAASQITAETERQIGEQWYRSLTNAYAVDSVRSRQLQQFFDTLGYEGPFRIQVTVVHEPVVNAFAVPGGHIVVFDSIIGLMDAPEQLAGLLAHEASHVQLRHSTRSIFRKLANQLFFSILIGSFGDLSGIVAQHSNALADLSYSRDLELEADESGLQAMRKSRLPLRGMPDLFRKMQAAAGDSTDVPTFLSTHPALEERILQAEKNIAASGAGRDTIPPALQQIWNALKQQPPKG